MTDVFALLQNPVSSFNGAHPIMGLVVALLALLNVGQVYVYDILLL